MLDAYIIDAIREEELERERDFERRRIRLHLPIPMPEYRRERDKSEDARDDDPVVIPFQPEMPIRRGDEDAA